MERNRKILLLKVDSVKNLVIIKSTEGHFSKHLKHKISFITHLLQTALIFFKENNEKDV